MLITIHVDETSHKAQFSFSSRPKPSRLVMLLLGQLVRAIDPECGHHCVAIDDARDAAPIDAEVSSAQAAPLLGP
jgi:hypothetical protein